MKFGDYCLLPIVSVDTKKDLYELAYDIHQDHKRFHDEYEGAMQSGVQLVVLVENLEGVSDLKSLAKWSEPDEHLVIRPYARKRVFGKELAKACSTIQEKYGTKFVFCKPVEAAERVVRILLEGGRR